MSPSKNDVIICSGYRVKPEKIAEHVAVADSGVIEVPDETRDEVRKAFVTLARGYETSDGLVVELQEFIEDRLAADEHPREIEFVADLPTTPVSGKIQRAKLHDREGL